MEHIRNLKLKHIVAILGLGAALVLVKSCGKEEDMGVVEIVDEVDDSTCFDEIVLENDQDILEKVDEVFDYVDVSNQLHKLNFNRKDVKTDGKELLSSEEIQLLMEQLKEKKYEMGIDELLELETELTTQEKLVNRYLYEQGYDTVAEANLMCLKAKVMDINGMDQDQYDEIVIPASNEIPRFDKVTFYNLNISSNGEFSSLLNSIYLMQNKGDFYKRETEDCELYNKDRNVFIKNAIEDLKKVLKNRYRLGWFGKIKKVEKLVK